MSARKVGPNSSSPFNYIVCLDVIVLACILVVAGRPDGLAITVSAVIVAAAALVYRCTLGVKSAMADRSRKKNADVERDDRSFKPNTHKAPAASIADSGSRSKSWLRDAD